MRKGARGRGGLKEARKLVNPSGGCQCVPFWMLKHNTRVKVFMVPLRETILPIVAMPLIRERRVRGMLSEIKPLIYHSWGNVGGLLLQPCNLFP